MGRGINQIPPAVIESLISYDWPGNVRELRNVLERSVITSPDSTLYLPERIGGVDREPIEAVDDRAYGTLDAVARRHIPGVLESTDWRISGSGGSAKILGLNASTLRFRMKKLGIGRNETSKR